MSRQIIQSSPFDLRGGTSSPVIEHFQEPFSLANDGATFDMVVDGSVTVQKFIVEAEDAGGIYKEIDEVRVWLHSGNMDISTSTELRRFGGATAANTPLGTGIGVIYKRGGVDSDMLGHSVTTLGELVTSFDDVLSAVDGESNGIDIVRAIIRFEHPVRLYPGTGDHIGVHIQDDMTGIARIHAAAKGRREVV